MTRRSHTTRRTLPPTRAIRRVRRRSATHGTPHRPLQAAERLARFARRTLQPLARRLAFDIAATLAANAVAHHVSRLLTP